MIRLLSVLLALSPQRIVFYTKILNRFFVDINPDTLDSDLNKLEKTIIKKIKTILVVDIFGHLANWGKILKIDRINHPKVLDGRFNYIFSKYNFWVYYLLFTINVNIS